MELTSQFLSTHSPSFAPLLCLFSFYFTEKVCANAAPQTRRKDQRKQWKERKPERGWERARLRGKSSGDVVKIMNNLTLITFALWQCVAASSMTSPVHTKINLYKWKQSTQNIPLNTIQFSCINVCVCVVEFRIVCMAQKCWTTTLPWRWLDFPSFFLSSPLCSLAFRDTYTPTLRMCRQR